MEIAEAEDGIYRAEVINRSNGGVWSARTITLQPIGADAQSYGYVNSRITIVPTGISDDVRSAVSLLLVGVAMLLTAWAVTEIVRGRRVCVN